MVCVLSMSRLAGIESTQVGDPLAHLAAGLANGISFDRVTGGSFALAVSVAEDEDVAELVLLCRDSTEGSIVAEGPAKVPPLGEDRALFVPVLSCSGRGRDLDRSTEIKHCSVSDVRWSSCHGVDCG